MSGMDGLQMLKEIKRINPKIDVIVITAYGTIEGAVEAIKAGAFDYITKPVELDKLLLLLARVTDKRGK
jgi:DNA-binding NtrC family response regulator